MVGGGAFKSRCNSSITRTLLAFGLLKQSLEAALRVPGGDVNSLGILPGVSQATGEKLH